MTREDAIHILIDLINPNDDSEEAVEMAISALEQEPCEDAISRRALLDKLNEWDWQELYLPIHFKENIIDELPSVTPSIDLDKHDEELIKETVSNVWGTVVPMSVIDDIRAEIYEELNNDEGASYGLGIALGIIAKHISGKD